MMQATPSLSFVDALNSATSKIFQFQGRARRSEFWWTKLLVFLLSCLLTPFVGFVLELLTIPLTFRRLHDTGRSGWWWGIGALMNLTFFLLLGFDVTRTILNAADMEYDYEYFFTFCFKYGMFASINAIYQIVLIVLCCIDSEPFENHYGPSPKHVDKPDSTTTTSL